MSDTSDDPLYRDPALAEFYDAANRWGPDFDYCMALAQGARSVLDLGCGTGELTAALADGRSVTGADPAGAMLDIGRKRPGGALVDWVEADARSMRLGRRFDLVLLTGHAFQVFLTDADQRAALATIAAHLEPTGRFIFDSRNPGFRDPNKLTHKSSRLLDHPEHGEIDAWNSSAYDPASGILSYENGYRVTATNRAVSASAQILYTSREKLEAMIGDAGLTVERWLGDWDGSDYHEKAREIIPLGRLA